MVRLCPVLIAVFAAAPCHAGPWGQPHGDLYSRVAISLGEVEGLASGRVDAYAEYGLSDTWTSTLKYERVAFDGYPEFTADGWRATLRRPFRLGETYQASIEFGLLEGAAIGGAAGCKSLGVEGRAGLGRSYKENTEQDRDGFWFADIAYRAHEDGCERYRLEAGWGREIYPGIWTITQAWLDDGTTNASSQKYQFEYLWRLPAVDLSIGVLQELGGEFEESAAFFAVAKTF
ncbi:hypothetical protein [Henriciella litoralis]|uniref:hypothetical protein n=1 Tax=Henriciella litoralis TaxID=568102 RepID=UPI000A065291|nr:hypothetical protein [Henriciella litoralis]